MVGDHSQDVHRRRQFVMREVLWVDHLEYRTGRKPELAVSCSGMSGREGTPASSGPIQRVIEFKLQPSGRIPRPSLHIALADIHKTTGQMKPETPILIVNQILYFFAR